MPLRLFNTYRKDYEEFTPLNTSKVGIYMCGMTVQDRPHLGHIRTFIFGDVFRRYLEFRGYEVAFIQNFTDIDDKIIEKSKIEGVDWRHLGDKNINEYLTSAMQLNIKPATYYPKATQFIQEIIETITTLIEKGFAYEANGSVYFEVSKFKNYGKLSGKNLDDLKESFRIDPDPNKKSPFDFALWKAWKEGEPYWFSPWGRGRPGWHIECSVMSTHFLGQPFDIHMGGQDLIFPHHEDEIAQAESARDKPFVKYWIHSAPMLLKGEKMSKSTGLYFAIKDLLKNYSPEAIRLFILQKHYRSPAEYIPDYLEEAEKAIERIKNFLKASPAVEHIGPVKEAVIQRFQEALDDDLNTPRAVSLLFDLVKEGNQKLSENINPHEEKKTLLLLMEVLGFNISNLLMEKVETDLIRDVVKIILDVRQELRKNKEFSLADRIRKELEGIGIKIKDTKEGTTFEF